MSRLDMDGVGSYEQKSTIEPESRGNRVIIANRREPNIYWATSKDGGTPPPPLPPTTGQPTTGTRDQQPIAQQASSTSCLPPCFCSSLFCGLCSSQEPAGAEKSLSRGRWKQQRRPSEHSGPTLSYSSSASASQSTFDFGPFPSNVWKTSKYTLVNFLFKNLYEQFRRMANFYFLITAIVQIAIPYSPIGPSTSLIPLFFVVGTTAIKQAYEDYLRHKLDNEINHRICCVLRENGQIAKVRSKDIRVGDIVYVKNNEEIPCDMILLASSGNGDRCYITTANLDGETSLKSRTCFQIHQQVGDIDQINDTMLVLECEKPNATLYEFNGYLRAPKDQAAYESLMKDIKHLDEFRDLNNSNQQQQQQQPYRSGLTTVGSDHKRLSIVSTIFQRIKVASFNSKMSKHLSANQLRTIGANTLVENNSLKHIDIPLDISNLLLRASRLRNTSFIYGLAVYTGPDTRLAYNSHVKPNKFSSLESRVNAFLVIAFLLLLLLTLISALKHRKNESDSPVDSTIAAVRADSFFQLFMAYFVLYNYLVPISLYVTLEFVKFLGTISVLEDKKLQGQVTSGGGSSSSTSVANSTSASSSEANTRSTTTVESADQQKSKQKSRAKKEAAAQRLLGPKCNTSDLNEDLGQVEVLFSDKTGTLTENKMHFMACSIQGHLYRAIAGQIYEQPEGLCFMPRLNVARKLSRISTNRYAALAADLAVHASPRSIGGGGGFSTPGGPKSASRSSRSSSERMAKLPAHQRPFDHRHVPPLRDFKPVDTLEQYNRLSEFLLCLCLCSTITLNEQTPIEECLPRASGGPTETMHYDYQSASPDEESLITAAASFGVIVCKSSERECFVAIRRPAIMSKHPAEEFQSSSKQFKPLVETKKSNDKYLVRHFERLITFEFNSVRKKMSVLYRDCDNDCVVMFTKGSESVLDCIATPADDAGSGVGRASSPPRPSKSPGQSSSHQTRSPLAAAAASAAAGRDYEKIINATLGHFEAFSKSGLRTMLVAMRAVSMQEYEKLNGELREARLLPMQDARELRMAQLYRSIESHMNLIGATAVEDSLQDGVPETIAQLKEAGIKVWLLTGDKVETAISVAYLCKLLDRNMNLLHLVRQQDSKSCKDLLTSYVNVIKTALLYGEDDEQDSSLLASSPTSSHQRESVSKRPLSQSQKYNHNHARGQQQQQQQQKGNGGSSPNKQQQSTVLSCSASSLSNININKLQSLMATNEMDMPRFAMIADGRSLHYAMKYAKEELEFVVTRCVCVLGCRLSPLQKAEIVDMIKNSADEPITAAIGDGANDVSMIQEAHVGIGISGKEGRQAVNSSDFAINRFHMISRLFFVHGHLFYHRTANTVHYFFYKNLLFIMPQFLYSFYNLSSATSLYHPIMMIAFNMLFTSFPILLYGLFEINIPMRLLENYPRFYRINNRNKKMSYTTFLTWLLMGTVQALIAFYITQFIWDSPEPIIEANKITSPMYFSSILFTALILCVTTKLYFISRNPSCSFHCASIFSCLILPITLYVFSLFDLSRLFSDNSLHQQYAPLARSPTYWLAIATVTAAMVIPDMIEYIKRQIDYYRMINSRSHHRCCRSRTSRTRPHIRPPAYWQLYISNIGDKNNKDGSQPKRSKRRAPKHAKDGAAKDGTAAAAAAAAAAAGGGGRDNKEDSATSDNKGTGYQDIIGSLVAREFKLIKLLGSGSYGAVYLGKNIVTQEQVAVKLEHKATKAPQLPLEYRFIKMIGPVEGFPRIIRIDECAGTYHAMVMELLGPSLEEVFNVCERRLSLKSVLYLSLQLLTRFQTLHAKNIIYRDVKPENFLLGRPGMDKEHIVHIIDYGLAKEYINPESGTHIAFRGQRGAIGTARYMSVNTHMGKEQSRRDDLEALGYVLIYLTRGSLPWQGLPATDHRERMRKIGEMKRRLPVEEICERCPDEFTSYLRYVKHLDFYEAPDYDYLKKLFYDLFVANRFVDDGVYDWSGKFESRTT